MWTLTGLPSNNTVNSVWCCAKPTQRHFCQIFNPGLFGERVLFLGAPSCILKKNIYNYKVIFLLIWCIFQISGFWGAFVRMRIADEKLKFQHKHTYTRKSRFHSLVLIHFVQVLKTGKDKLFLKLYSNSCWHLGWLAIDTGFHETVTDNYRYPISQWLLIICAEILQYFLGKRRCYFSSGVIVDYELLKCAGAWPLGAL